MINRENRRKAFTFVELLIAMAVMSILLAISIVAYMAVRKTGRDTVRKQVMNQYKTGIEQFYASNNYYPTGRQSIIDALPTPIGSDGLNVLKPDFMSSLIPDPDISTITQPLTYIGNDEGTFYTLHSELEMGGFWVVCSSAGGGKVGKLDIAPGTWSDTCPL